jgi:hypothetical protein
MTRATLINVDTGEPTIVQWLDDDQAIKDITGAVASNKFMATNIHMRQSHRPCDRPNKNPLPFVTDGVCERDRGHAGPCIFGVKAR